MPNTLKMAALAVAVSVAAMVAAPCAAAQPDPTAPADFVLLGDIDPSIVLDIRYITAHNFTADPVDGYQAPMCILTPPAAEALARATAQFVEQGYSLKVRSADEGGDCAAPVSERFPDNTIDMAATASTPWRTHSTTASRARRPTTYRAPHGASRLPLRDSLQDKVIRLLTRSRGSSVLLGSNPPAGWRRVSPRASTASAWASCLSTATDHRAIVPERALRRHI